MAIVSQKCMILFSTELYHKSATGYHRCTETKSVNALSS